MLETRLTFSDTGQKATQTHRNWETSILFTSTPYLIPGRTVVGSNEFELLCSIKTGMKNKQGP